MVTFFNFNFLLFFILFFPLSYLVSSKYMFLSFHFLFFFFFFLFSSFFFFLHTRILLLSPLHALALSFKGKVNPIQSTTKPKTKNQNQIPNPFWAKNNRNQRIKNKTPKSFPQFQPQEPLLKILPWFDPWTPPQMGFPQNLFPLSFILWFSLPIWSLSHLPNLFLIHI